MTIPVDDPARTRRAIELGLAARLHEAIRDAEAMADSIECPHGPRNADEALAGVADWLPGHVADLREIADDLADRTALLWLLALALVVGGAIGLAISIGGVV